jgi:hypothetical protein
MNIHSPEPHRELTFVFMFKTIGTFLREYGWFILIGALLCGYLVADELLRWTPDCSFLEPSMSCTRRGVRLF